MTDEILRQILQEHTRTYDAIAQEYESRVSALKSITEEAVHWMSEYIPENGKILELGCGVGLAASLFVRQHFQVMAIDLSSQMLAHARKREPLVKFIQGDFLVTDFHGSFDGVFAFAFIHLFPKPVAQKVLEKVYALLNTEGVLYVGTTMAQSSCEGWEIKTDYEAQHKRYRKHWTHEEFIEALTSAGFYIVEEKQYVDPFGKTWMDVIARKGS